MAEFHPNSPGAAPTRRHPHRRGCRLLYQWPPRRAVPTAATPGENEGGSAILLPRRALLPLLSGWQGGGEGGVASSTGAYYTALCSLNGVEPQWLFWVLWTPHFFAEPS